MVESRTRLGRFLAALRSRTGRRVLLLGLVVAVGFVVWWFVGRLPAEGTVEVRWTESPPSSVAVSYINGDGETVRYRREAIRPGTDRFRDVYELSPDRYWLRIEVRLPDGVHTVRRRVELPSADPYVLYLEEQSELGP
ncbi:MAG: hypothetical protein JXB32_00165 [Deltaproteobacteria bacterium]|nr:hypothetical protein [Deltaproteobacteria bacterium]